MYNVYIEGKEDETMKYDLSKIMKAAWARYNKYNAPYGKNREGKKIIVHTFAECLKTAWSEAKEAARVFAGMIRNIKVGGTVCHPVLVNVDMYNLTVTGNTFPVRQLMRELGLSWDGIAKAWIGSRETLNALCIKYA